MILPINILAFTTLFACTTYTLAFVPAMNGVPMTARTVFGARPQQSHDYHNFHRYSHLYSSYAPDSSIDSSSLQYEQMMSSMPSLLSAATVNDDDDRPTMSTRLSQHGPSPSTPPTAPSKIKKQASKPAASLHKQQQGVFSPLVLTAKKVMGEERLNKVRAKAISMHSDIISRFVDSVDTSVGTAILRVLYNLADKNRNGIIEEDELVLAFQTLGFDWLQEKQIKGILSRADSDGNGVIDWNEWLAEAPKTLRTNLIKLAKKNGGELGFLV